MQSLAPLDTEYHVGGLRRGLAQHAGDKTVIAIGQVLLDHAKSGDVDRRASTGVQVLLLLRLLDLAVQLFAAEAEVKQHETVRRVVGNLVGRPDVVRKARQPGRSE